MKSKFKNINSFILGKRLLFIFAALLICSGEMWGWGVDYKVTVNTQSQPSGAGKVYTSKKSTTSPSYQTGTSSATYSGTTYSSLSLDFYLYTTPVDNDLAIFKGWAQSATATTYESTEANGYKVTISGSSSSEAKQTKNYYAIYESHCRLYAQSSPSQGGYVYVTDKSNTITEAFVKETGLTSDYADRTAKTTFTASAAPADGYNFKGWATSAAYGSYVSTQPLNAEKEIDLLNKVTWYAMFTPYWKFSATAIATLNGVESKVGGTATASVAQSEIESTDGTTTPRSTTATYTATPEKGYAFQGWAKSLGTTTIEEGYYSNPLEINLENSAIGTTVNRTLYAVFYELVDPTAMSVSPTYIELTKDATKKITVTMTPELCYKELTFTSSNPAAATVDANGLVTGVKSGTSTITVTAKKKDGTVAFTKTVTVKVMEKLPTPVLTVEGVEADNYDKALVTITAGEGSPAGTILRYTTDGTEPTSKSTEYTAPFKINNLQTIKARAYCTDWYESDVVSQTYSKRVTSTPTINITLSNNEYVVTFSCTDDDVTFYYTTDGTTPSKTNGKAWKVTDAAISQSSLPAECTIRVIATHEEWQDSKVASREYIRASGSDGSTVYINDYEDHTWTYYSGIGDMSTNPYSYPTRLYSPNPRNVKIIYDANGAKVSLESTENETRFIYYETLEQGSTSGQYPYTVISNPFSKRPTGQGFAGWMIVDGGEYISGKKNNDVISLDETITFVNLPYPSVNCTSATIELQATWTTANIKNATSGDISFTGGTYETNFVVMKSSSSSTLNLKSPCTVMAVEPDGSADYRSNTFSGTISPSNSTMSKIEFVNWQGGSRSEFSAEGKNVTIGRGLTTSSTTISHLYGCSDNTANQVFKIESGKYTYFDNYETEPSSITKQYVIFGCDYDRAKNDNTKLNITSSMEISDNRVASSDDVEVCRVYSKSGQFVSGEKIGSGTADQSYYFGFSGTESYVGYRYLEIQGGIWHNIAGGMSTNHSASKLAVEYRMKGGTVLGCMYGAAQFADAAGIRKFVFTGGTVNGWVAGGANGTDSKGGELNGSTFVYIGGRCQVTSNNSTTIINHAVGGNVFGAGCGNGASSDAGIVHNGTNVVFADDAYVERGVYGGGGFGYTKSAANLFITGGHCGGVKGGVASDGSSIDKNLQGGIFGGACQNDGNTVKILMTGGIIEGGLYGGSNSTGDVSSVNMTIAGGQIGTKTNLTAMACGGGYGSSTNITGNVTMILGINGFKDASGNAVSPYFYGNCYGGAALGKVGGSVNMTINTGGSYAGGNGEGGEIYCGGLGDKDSPSSSSGNVTGSLTTTVNGTDEHPGEGKYAYNAVYGGCHYINQSKTPTITVNGCDVSIQEVYGGSKLATLSGTNITVNGGNRIGNVYGGSNAANINGNVTLKVLGGGIDRVFGGNNNSGTISGTINMLIDQQSSCDMNLGQVYGGGNKAASNSVAINIGCPGYIGQLYGGANEANITGNIVLDIHGGTYGAIYGGNNKSGTVSGSVTINASKNSTCALEIDTIFGGGNLADLAQSTNKVIVNVSGDETKVGNIYGGGNLASVYSTQVNVSGGQVSGNIFGGGKGSTGSTKPMILSGGTNVNITGGTLTNVFGGNDAGGKITGTLKTTIDKATALDITGEVYGGGNEASSDAGQLYINCADHIGSVYGGARNADITGNIGLNIGSGTIDNVFGGNNLGGNVTGTITINVKHTGCSLIRIGNLYGAGNLADYTVPGGNAYGPIINLKPCGKSPVDWVNSGQHCLKVGKLFGAGKGTSEGEYKGKGKVIGNPQVNINAGEIDTIYGGGNLADVEGSTYVNIIDSLPGDNQDIYVTGNVYGGGNNAAVTGSSNVQIGQKDDSPAKPEVQTAAQASTTKATTRANTSKATTTKARTARATASRTTKANANAKAKASTSKASTKAKAGTGKRK